MPASGDAHWLGPAVVIAKLAWPGVYMGCTWAGAAAAYIVPCCGVMEVPGRAFAVRSGDVGTETCKGRDKFRDL